jgi:hypothetical protein
VPQIVNGVPVGILTLTVDQLQAIEDTLKGKRQVRMKKGENWTALQHMDLITQVSSELALLKAEVALSKKVLAY